MVRRCLYLGIIVVFIWVQGALADDARDLFLPPTQSKINLISVLHSEDGHQVQTTWNGTLLEENKDWILELQSPELKSTMRFQFAHQGPLTYRISFPEQEIKGETRGQEPLILRAAPFPVYFPAWNWWTTKEFMVDHEVGDLKYQESIAQEVRVISSQELPEGILADINPALPIYAVLLRTKKEIIYQLWQEGCPWPKYISRDNFEAWMP